ncbi:MAG: porin family protein [Bacteroidota bacterium]|nr:porin family protein [Bacteroidota bacterium]
MKRIIFVLLLSLFITQLVRAQHKPFMFGFEVSPNVGWFRSDHTDYENDGSEVGFSWGFVSEFFLMENYAIATGFDVVYLNGRLAYPHQPDSLIGSGILHRKYRTKYIEVPLVLKMKTNEFGKFRFYGKIGLGTSFLLTAKGTDKFIGETEKISEDEKDIKDEVKGIRESLILGAGVEYNLGGSTALTFGITFDNGFTDVLKDQNTLDPEITHQAINNYIEFNLGVIF